MSTIPFNDIDVKKKIRFREPFEYRHSICKVDGGYRFIEPSYKFVVRKKNGKKEVVRRLVREKLSVDSINLVRNKYLAGFMFFVFTYAYMSFLYGKDFFVGGELNGNDKEEQERRRIFSFLLDNFRGPEILKLYYCIAVGLMEQEIGRKGREEKEKVDKFGDSELYKKDLCGKLQKRLLRTACCGIDFLMRFFCGMIFVCKRCRDRFFKELEWLIDCFMNFCRKKFPGCLFLWVTLTKRDRGLLYDFEVLNSAVSKLRTVEIPYDVFMRLVNQHISNWRENYFKKYGNKGLYEKEKKYRKQIEEFIRNKTFWKKGKGRERRKEEWLCDVPLVYGERYVSLKNCVHAIFSFTEIKKKDTSDNVKYHVHLHNVFCVREYIPYFVLCVFWEFVCEEGNQIDIRKLRKGKSIAKYLSKYVKKGDKFEPDEHLQSVLHNRRKFKILGGREFLKEFGEYKEDEFGSKKCMFCGDDRQLYGECRCINRVVEVGDGGECSSYNGDVIDVSDDSMEQGKVFFGQCVGEPATDLLEVLGLKLELDCNDYSELDDIDIYEIIGRSMGRLSDARNILEKEGYRVVDYIEKGECVTKVYGKKLYNWYVPLLVTSSFVVVVPYGDVSEEKRVRKILENSYTRRLYVVNDI